MPPESPDPPPERSVPAPISGGSELLDDADRRSACVADHKSAQSSKFPVVAIGASAGGLEALRQLFAHLPDDTGMAFIVIQHLDPDRPSLLTAVLSGDLRMPVIEVTEGMRAEPNRVHVIPPGSDLSIAQGILTLSPRQLTRRLHLPIDSFFRALADDELATAIGIVLSGSASDGTEGLRAIKAAGGITFVQSPESAQFPSMPESAISAGVVDFSLSPQAIANELARLSRDPYLAPARGTESVEETRFAEEDSLPSILAAVRQHAKLDLRGYKRAVSSGSSLGNSINPSAASASHFLNNR